MKLQGLSADIQHRTPTSSWNMTINDFNPKRPHLPLRSFSNSKSTVQCSSSYPTTATMRYHLAIHRTLALIILVSHVCGAFLAPGQPGARVCKSEDRSTSRTGCASHVTRMAATEFGGIQHAGVLVSNTKASKVSFVPDLSLPIELFPASTFVSKVTNTSLTHFVPAFELSRTCGLSWTKLKVDTP